MKSPTRAARLRHPRAAHLHLWTRRTEAESRLQLAHKLTGRVQVRCTSHVLDAVGLAVLRMPPTRAPQTVREHWLARSVAGFARLHSPAQPGQVPVRTGLAFTPLASGFPEAVPLQSSACCWIRQPAAGLHGAGSTLLDYQLAGRKAFIYASTPSFCAHEGCPSNQPLPLPLRQILDVRPSARSLLGFKQWRTKRILDSEDECLLIYADLECRACSGELLHRCFATQSPHTCCGLRLMLHPAFCNVH